MNDTRQAVRRLRAKNRDLAAEVACLRMQLEMWMEAHGSAVKRGNGYVAARDAAEALVIDHQVVTGGWQS